MKIEKQKCDMCGKEDALGNYDALCGWYKFGWFHHSKDCCSIECVLKHMKEIKKISKK